MFEMWTLNPSLVRDSILALDAITEYQAFNTILYVGALLGFVGIIVSKATTMGKQNSRGIQSLAVALLIFVVGVRSEADLAITNPVTAESYVVTDVPAGLAMLAWGTSAIGGVFQDMYRTQFSVAGVGDVLAREGVGRGLSILTGMQGVPWTDRTRTAGNTGTNVTNLEASIGNYLNDCFNKMMTRDGASYDRWTAFHKRGESDTLTSLWTRVSAPIVATTVTYINAPSTDGTSELCWDAWSSIDTAINTTEFKTALAEEHIDHLASYIAAMSSPGASATLDPGVASTQVRTKMQNDANQILTALFGDTETRLRIMMLDRLNTMLLNAYNSSPRAQVAPAVGRLASAWDDAKRQADLSMAAQGDWWVRNAKPMTQFLELIALGMLPILMFMAFVSPQGGKALISLVGVYFWLQTWPIAYIIINHAALGSMTNTFSMYLASTDSMGMEGLYQMWDQARHSFAVSQSLLGMTPIITGAMLSGSMMMLTKLASNVSANENLDEKRVYSDTESSAPLYQRQSQTGFQTDSAGNLQRNRDLTGTGTDIRLSDVASTQVASAEAQRMLAAQNYTQSFNNTVGHAVQTASTESLNQMVSQAKGYEEGFDSQAIATDANIQSSTQSYASKNAANLAAKLQANAKGGADKNFLTDLGNNDKDAQRRLGQVLSGGVGFAGEAGISTELAQALVSEYRESEEFKQALSQHLRGSESFNDQDTFQKIAQNTDVLSEQDAKQLSKSLSLQESSEKSYQQVKNAAQSISADRTIDEGRQWEVMDEMADEISKAGTGLTGDERKSEMIRKAQELGFSDAGAALMVSGIEQQLWEDRAPSNAGSYAEGAGLLSLLRDANVYTGLEKAVVKNDDRLGDNVRRLFLNIANPENEVNNGNLATEAGKVKQAVNQATGDAEALPDDVLKEFTPEQQAMINNLKGNVEDKVKFVKLMTQIQEAIAEQQDKNAAKADGDLGLIDMISGGESVVSLPTVFLKDDEASNQTRREFAESNAKSRYLEIVFAASVAAEMAENSGQNQEVQQWQSDIAMSNLLRGNDKDVFDELKEKGDIESASAFLRNKMDEAGIKSDVASIKEFGKRIDYTDYLFGDDNRDANGLSYGEEDAQASSGYYDIDKLGIFEAIGNKLKDIDNNEIEAMINDLDNQTGTFAEKEYTLKAYADSRAENNYGDTKRKLTENREGDKEYLTDVILAELMALVPYVALEGQSTEFGVALENIRLEASGLESGLLSGIMGVASGAFGNKMAEGMSIDRSEIEALVDIQLGEGSYQRLRDELPNDLKDKINTDFANIIKERMQDISEKMRPESQALAMEDQTKEAINGMDVDAEMKAILERAVKSGQGAEVVAMAAQVKASEGEIDWQATATEALGTAEFERYKQETMEAFKAKP